MSVDTAPSRWSVVEEYPHWELGYLLASVLVLHGITEPGFTGGLSAVFGAQILLVGYARHYGWFRWARSRQPDPT